MLHYLLLHLFLLPMIPLPLYSSGFTGCKLRVISNCLINATIALSRHCICFNFPIFWQFFKYCIFNTLKNNICNIQLFSKYVNYILKREGLMEFSEVSETPPLLQ